MTIDTTKNMHGQLASQNPSETVSKMTNREWLQSLSDEAFVRVAIHDNCHCCTREMCDYYEQSDATTCYKRQMKWLQAEYKEK